MRVISIAYMAFVPKSKLNFKAGDDAAEVEIFTIDFENDKMIFRNENNSFSEDELAFDHKKIITTAISRLRNRIDYTFDAFKFLKNKNEFTVSELRKIFETVTCKKIDAGNFNRDFKHKFLETNIVTSLDKYSKENSKRGARLYKFNK
jgi:8-oxo-dGTP diphosphatase